MKHKANHDHRRVVVGAIDGRRVIDGCKRNRRWNPSGKCLKNLTYVDPSTHRRLIDGDAADSPMKSNRCRSVDDLPYGGHRRRRLPAALIGETVDGNNG
jgi:hypothetical protein